MKMFTSLTAYLYVFTLRYIFRTTKPLKQGMESLQTCVKWIASTFPWHMHTIAPLKENVALDITHAVGVEKLDREEREVNYMLIKYPLIQWCSQAGHTGAHALATKGRAPPVQVLALIVSLLTRIGH